jgi:hypothetical protein
MNKAASIIKKNFVEIFKVDPSYLSFISGTVAAGAIEIIINLLFSEKARSILIFLSPIALLISSLYFIKLSMILQSISTSAIENDIRGDNRREFINKNIDERTPLLIRILASSLATACVGIVVLGLFD